MEEITMRQDAQRSPHKLADAELAARIEERLQEIEVSLVVSVSKQLVTLRGAVSSPPQKQAALGIARGMAEGRPVRDEIDVRASEPEPAHPTQLVARAHELEPEVEDRYVTDITRTIEDAQPFFPPTDPVVARTDQGLEMRGGFGATSMDELTDEAPPELPEEAGLRGDEAIADDVRRELGEDAMTAHLRIAVAVRDGVVTLRGPVPDLEDADAVEEVAARVPGVVDVREQLTVEGL